MILTKGFRTQSSLCRSQSGSLIHIQSGSNWQKLLCNSVPKHCIFAAVKVPTAVTLAMYCVCSPNDRLYFHQIIQTKVFLTQDGVLASEKGSPDHKSGLDWYQKEPQTPCFFSLTEDLTAVTIAINQLLGLTIVSPDHTVVSRPQKWLNIVKNVNNNAKSCTFCSHRGPNRCYISNQSLCFHQMTLTKVFMTQNEVSTSERGSPTIKTVQIAQKLLTMLKNTTLLLWGSQQLLQQ